MPAYSPKKTDKRRAAEKRGRLAEIVALAYLRVRGYRLLARRFKCNLGEVDLVMRRRDVTVFIEVKARASRDLGVSAVTPGQSRRIAAAARSWMSRDPQAARDFCRFDIVVVCPYQWPHHIENAFPGDA